jgi:hypothetical protein
MLPELRVLIGSEQAIREDDRFLDQLTYRLGLDSEVRLDFNAVREAARSRADSTPG